VACSKSPVAMRTRLPSVSISRKSGRISRLSAFRDAVVNLYQVQATLGREIVRGEPTAKELALAEQLDRQFATDEWLYQKGGLRQSGVKIHEDVRVLEVAHKAPGGLIRVTARVREGRLDDVTLGRGIIASDRAGCG